MINMEDPLLQVESDESTDPNKQPVITNMADWLEMDEDIDFEPEPISLGLQEIEID